MTALTGTIVKGIGGFYYVDTGSGVYECRARGRFRLEETCPLVGDRVEISADEKKQTGYVTDVFERKSSMLRPPVANVDQFILVLSASVPKPDPMLVDKLLLQARAAKVQALLVLNKCDEEDPDVAAAIEGDYAHAGIELLRTSASTGEGVSELAGRLKDRISCFAGQSAVGKSSLINALSPGLTLKTGGLSKKTDRGKHTTRHTELIELCGGYVVDTPGFSLLELLPMEPEELCQCYPEFTEYNGKCRFLDCVHLKEPDCAVKEQVEAGKIPKGRYERYCLLLEELKELKRRRYE